MRLFADVASRVDDPYLAHAIALAERGRGRTAPNPLVGCVVALDGRIVGEGFHPRAGEAHAEVFALADAGAAARGATACVTLEPCRHHGRTPPCTDALIAAGVSRVVIGMHDPTAQAGGGGEVLAGAGIDVSFAPDPSPFADLNEGWLKRTATGLPFVTAKVALSLDGRPAFEAGMRAAITGPSGAVVTRRLRSAADAVLVGAATLVADDPALTVRNEQGVRAEHQPLRVVLAGSSPLPGDARVFSDGGATIVLVSDAAPATVTSLLPPDVEVISYPATEGVRGALKALGAHGVGELLVEPGPRLFATLWAEDLLDALAVVTAGGLAGADAPSLFGGEADRDGDELTRRAVPFEAGIVGDVSVTVWRPRAAEE